MKTILPTLLLLPFLSFGQVSEKDKNSIDAYTITICECMNELMETLHPLTIDLILLTAEKGEDEAFIEFESKLAEMSEEEVEDFLLSVDKMASEEFEEYIDDCGEASELDAELDESINSEEGGAFEYLLEVLNREKACKIMSALYEIGEVGEE